MAPRGLGKLAARSPLLAEARAVRSHSFFASATIVRGGDVDAEADREASRVRPASAANGEHSDQSCASDHSLSTTYTSPVGVRVTGTVVRGTDGSGNLETPATQVHDG